MKEKNEIKKWKKYTFKKFFYKDVEILKSLHTQVETKYCVTIRKEHGESKLWNKGLKSLYSTKKPL